MEVVANESRIRIRLRHQNSREANAAADVSNPAAACQLFFNALQSGQPCGHDVVDVTGTEEGPGRTEQTARGIAPANTTAGTKCRLNLLLAFNITESLVDSTKRSWVRTS